MNFKKRISELHEEMDTKGNKEKDALFVLWVEDDQIKTSSVVGSSLTLAAAFSKYLLDNEDMLPTFTAATKMANNLSKVLSKK